MGSRRPAGIGALRVLLTLLVAVALRSYGAPAQLTAATGEVRDFHSTASAIVYAATFGGGLWRSTDSGASWTAVASLPPRYISKVAGSASDPNLLFAATRDGVWRSTNGGASWAQVSYEAARAIAVDPTNDQNVLIGVPGAGIYRSTNRGQTFALSSSGIDSTDIRALVPGPTAGMFFAGLYSNATGGWGGVFRSIDGGVTWASWNGSGAGALPSKYVTSLAVTPAGSLIAGVYDPAQGGIAYRRVGTGAWTAAMSSNTSGVLTLHPDRNTASTVWLGTRVQGVYKSTNDGVSFVASSNSTQDVFTDVLALGTVPGASGRVLAAPAGLGIYRSADNGSSWPKSSTRLTADRAVALEPGASTSELFMGTLGGGMQRSTNSGASFTGVNGGLVNVTYGPKTLDVVSVAGAGSIVYAATFGFGGLYQWNGVSAWARVSEAGLPNAPADFSNPMSVGVDSSNPQNVFYTVFGGSYAGTWRRNGGPVWASVRPGPYDGAGAGRIVAGVQGTGRWYILNELAAADRSIDNGLTWSPIALSAAVPTGSMPITFFSLAENPLSPTNALASTSKGLLRSTDAGASWAPVNPGSVLTTELTGLTFSTLVSNRVFAGDRAGRFYCSNNAGATWIVRETFASAVVSVRWLNNLVYLATDGAGVMQRDPTCP